LFWVATAMTNPSSFGQQLAFNACAIYRRRFA
jgi:hypothetical protein